MGWGKEEEEVDEDENDLFYSPRAGKNNSYDTFGSLTDCRGLQI